MKILKRIMLLLVLTAAVSCAQPRIREPQVEEIIRIGRTDNQVMNHLNFLTNVIGPRLTASDNFNLACLWAADKFRSFGLKARLEEWGEFPVGFNRVYSMGKMIVPEEKPLQFATQAWSPGTNGPAAGPVVLVPATEQELDASKDRLKGAWVVKNSRWDRSFREKVYRLMEEQGALGILNGSNSELLLVQGNHGVAWDKLPKRVTVTLVKSQYDEIMKLLQDGQEVRLEFDIKNEFKNGPVKVYNVIADITGTEKPDELVIVSGHLDSWDGATGTTDNAVGCSTAIEAARLLMAAGVQPKRTIRFILWGGEEQGLLGSQAYVEKHKEDMAKISGMFNMDYGTNYVGGISETEAMAAAIEKAFEPVIGLDPEMPFGIERVKGLHGWGSDHASFSNVGVPAFEWHQKGRHDYEKTHHTTLDTFDQAVPEYLKHSAIVIAIGARNVANLDELLSREGFGEDHATPHGGGRRLGVDSDDDVVLNRITKDSPAEKAGLKEGDMILKIGALEVSDIQSLRKAIHAAEKESTVTILRDGQTLELPVTFEQ